MKKLWLTFTAMLLCSIASFAQTEIWTASGFLDSVGTSGSYKLMADINLGDLGARTASIIPTFSGTLDGNGKTITYQAKFTGANNNVDYSLFGSVSGTIDSLNVNASVTLGGTINNMNVALICGSLTADGVIEYCNVSGNVNSTVKPSAGGGSDAGLIVGQSAGKVRYCTGSGNVVGVGYVGGLIGQMTNSASVLACSFAGNVTSNQPSNSFGAEYGSFAGGICGYVSNSSTLEFCHVNIIVNAVETDNGISSSKEVVVQLPGWLGGGTYRDPQGTHTIRYSYATGEVGGDLVNGDNITNSEGTNSPNYYEGEMIADSIVAKLNRAIPEDEQDNFYFDIINGEVVLIIGQKPTEEPDQPEPAYAYYRTINNGDFNSHTTWEASETGAENTWVRDVAPEGTTANITIMEGHRVTVSHDLKITEDYKIAVNNGVLQITQQGQLINTSNVNVPGIVEIVSPQKKMNRWTFIGAPFEDNYKLGTIYPMSHDISVSKYDYSTANWSESWAHVETPMEAGEGYFAWPFYDGAVIFTTYGDVWNYEEGKVGEYDFNRQPKTETNLYNGDTTITKEFGNTTNGRWMALANPYPAKLDIEEFVGDNNIVSTNQGKGIYRLTNNVSNGAQTYTFVTSGDIAMTEGFFVNLASGNQVTFKKNQLTANQQQAKSQVAPREFVELSLVKGNYESKLYFAHNQEAEQNYDIFDANKLFALGEVAEPYFVTDGIALVKEEVKELPYYATMNVRSFANDTVSFVVNNIPEGLAVSIIDGENIIDMVEGGVYTTEILTGENADRFKVLIKKSVSISDVEELEVNITNNNRHISIETTETDLQVEVYNALGQKVLSTKDRNFTLNQVSAGAYLIKAFNNKASKTQKIVVE